MLYIRKPYIGKSYTYTTLAVAYIHWLKFRVTTPFFCWSKASNVADALWRNRVSAMYSAMLSQLVQSGLKVLNNVVNAMSSNWKPAIQKLTSDDWALVKLECGWHLLLALGNAIVVASRLQKHYCSGKARQTLKSGPSLVSSVLLSDARQAPRLCSGPDTNLQFIL